MFSMYELIPGQCSRILALLLAAFLMLSSLSGTRLGAHETVRYIPTAADLAKAAAPLPGSEEFARQVLEHLGSRFDDQQMELLDSIDSNLKQADQLRWGGPELAKPKEAEYFRWLAEQKLLELLASYADVIELDFRNGKPQHDPDKLIELDPQYNLILLKVITEDGPTDFRVQTWNMTAEYPHSAFPVKVGSGGTSFVLLKLEEVPEEKTVSMLAFLEDGSSAPTYWHALTLATRPWGYLDIDIREQSELTPVLMQIASRKGNRLWEPPGAIDLRSQLNDIVPHLSQLGRGYMFYLPGKNRGRYWIVPGSLEMVLPEGEWNLTILHGPEYMPIRETLKITADQKTQKNYHLSRWTNMPEKGWYSGDDHVHARLISSEDARNLLLYSQAVDIHVSNILEMGDHMRTYYAQRGFGPEFRVQGGIHWLVPGQEDPRSVLGHAIGLNLKSKVRDLDRYLLNDWIAQEIHQQGGLYGHTHMGANACVVHREMALFTPMEFVDFNSIMQANLGTELYYEMLNLGFKMTASAGADTPYGGTIGAVRVYANVGSEKDFLPDAWFEAVRRGKTFVTNGPMIEFCVEDSLPGDEITVTEDRPLRVSAKTWGLRGHSAPKSMKLVCLGETIEEIQSPDDQQESLELELFLPTGYGFWLAVLVEGWDGSEAHTTPIYVTREGFRHWNLELASKLIKKQLAVLDETESALRESEEIMISTRNALDYWNRLNAEQADEVRKRIQKTREIYQSLESQAAKERHARNSLSEADTSKHSKID